LEFVRKTEIFYKSSVEKHLTPYYWNKSLKNTFSANVSHLKIKIKNNLCLGLTVLWTWFTNPVYINLAD